MLGSGVARTGRRILLLLIPKEIPKVALIPKYLCRVWDMDTLECVRVLEGHNEAVLALAVGPSFLVSGSYDTTVRFWALDSLRCVRCSICPRCMGFLCRLS